MKTCAHTQAPICAEHVSLAKFTAWQKLSNRLVKKQVKLEANVDIPAGTSLQDTVDFFYALQDSSAVRVTFSGALSGYSEEELPQEICDLMDNHVLMEGIMVHLVCDPNEDEQDWRLTIMDCCRALEVLPLPVDESMSSSMPDMVLEDDEDSERDEELCIFDKRHREFITSQTGWVASAIRTFTS